MKHLREMRRSGLRITPYRSQRQTGVAGRKGRIRASVQMLLPESGRRGKKGSGKSFVKIRPARMERQTGTQE